MTPKILLVVGYFIPSFHGGISRTIQNLLSETSHKLEFEIITRDRDCKRESSYPSIRSNQWNKIKNTNIYYAEEISLSLKKILLILSDKSYDIIHLNSMFDILSIKFLILYRLNKIKNCKIILSPRGEFGDASFRIRKFKKIVYLFIMKKFGFFDDIIWHASTQIEKKEIKSFFKKKKLQCLIANDISTNVIVNKNRSNKYYSKINIIFLSSISPEKNLLYALNILKEVKRELKFDIYGPIIDQEYWKKCQQIIKNLPKNIELKYLGYIEEKKVLEVFSNYDLLFLPTGGENFGHVISEALSVGTKVLISNKTQWRRLQQNDLGWDIDLNQRRKFINIIQNIDKKMLSNNKKVRFKVIENFNSYYSKLTVIDDNIKLYNGIL